MARITKVYTRTGDDGTTALGTGARVPKNCLRIEAYGTVDELNCQIGVVLAASPITELVEPLRRLQNELLQLGADLCIPEADKNKRLGPQIEQHHITVLEQLIDSLNQSLPPLQNFILPGGSAAAAALHVARTICRRAERVLISLSEKEPIGEHLVPYLNRLSDVLFVMARFQNQQAGVTDPLWDSRA